MMPSRNLLSFCRDSLEKVYFSAVDAVKPEKIISRNVEVSGRSLRLGYGEGSKIVNLVDTNVRVLGFGKSALSMARAFSQLVIKSEDSSFFKGGFLIAPSHLNLGSKVECKNNHLLQTLNIACHFGSKSNLPDEDSVTATQDLVEFAKNSIKQDELSNRSSLFVVLIGGGGSACLSWPRYVNLNRKLEIIEFLQQKGADIIELNKVRRVLSHVKGGQLANKLLSFGSKVEIVSLIISDVIGNNLQYIASGPTCGPNEDIDPRIEMQRILAKYEFPGLSALLSHIPDKSQDLCLLGNRVSNMIIADNSLAKRAAEEAAERIHVRATTIPEPISGNTEDAVKVIRNLRYLDVPINEPVILIYAGETTVEKKANETWGCGGRVQEMALDYLAQGYNNKFPFSSIIDMFLAGTTDGQDGSTDVAASFASHSEWELNMRFESQEWMDAIIRAKKSHDSNTFFMKTKPEWLIKTGLTETNVMDLYMLMLVPGDKVELI